jgi:hypothetical protein
MFMEIPFLFPACIGTMNLSVIGNRLSFVAEQTEKAAESYPAA